jgi:hypothetical protein
MVEHSGFGAAAKPAKQPEDDGISDQRDRDGRI